jgi:hypothetical protein
MAPPAPTIYAPGLGSLNANGDIFLSRATTEVTFRGPATVLMVRTYPSVDYTPVVDLINSFNAPLVLAVFDSMNGTSLALLNAAYAALGRFYDSAKTRTPRLPTSANIDVPVVFGGPFICCAETSMGLTDAKGLAWDIAITYSRTSQNHPYLCGMQAVSTFSGNNLSPPVYALGTGDAAIASDAVTLGKKWRGEAVVTVSQYETLLAAAALRPGLARLVNAALVPYIVLADPVP